jgi:hypothetical protein
MTRWSTSSAPYLIIINTVQRLNELEVMLEIIFTLAKASMEIRSVLFLSAPFCSNLMMEMQGAP